jgi:hypothetical protein
MDATDTFKTYPEYTFVGDIYTDLFPANLHTDSP